MTIAPEVSTAIETECAALKKTDFKRPSMSMNKFIGEYSGNLAQAELDMDALVKAGFDAAQMPRYRALLEMLSLAYGDRMGMTLDSPDQRATFDTQFALAQTDRKRLAVVGAHIADQRNDKKVQQQYRNIAKGSGITDTLTDNLSLVALIKEYPQWAAEIKPGGIEINAQYMDEVVKRALDLLQMRGIVMDQGVTQNGTVDRQNRLLTLCVIAQSVIKKYARAAFFDNSEYYNSNYVSDIRRQSSDVEPVQPVVQPAAAVPA